MSDVTTTKKRAWFAKKQKEIEKSKEEKQPDPDDFSERYKRWKMMTFDGYVILRTLSRDNTRGEYVLESTLVKWSELPLDAVHCSGENKVYAVDKIKGSGWYIEEHIGAIRDYATTQFNATDAALHMKSNKMDNALTTHWTEFSHVDVRKIAIIAVAVLAVALLMLLR